VAALNANLSPFVRVPGRAEAGFIQRVLDNGAQGVIFPHVDVPGKHLLVLEIGTAFPISGIANKVLNPIQSKHRPL
jgi:2-keto-3-deoxy-L-rhamnonate aldolase RhmA